MGYSISPASLRLDDLTEPVVRLLRESGERSITIAPETGSDRLRRVINKTMTNDEILDRADLIFRDRHREPEAVLHDRPADGNRRRPGRDPRPVGRDQGTHAGARPPARAAGADRRQREPARAEAGHRLPVAADGGASGRSSTRSRGCGRSPPASTTSTSRSSPSGMPSTRRCCRSATGAWRRSSWRPNETAATGAPRRPRRASTRRSTSTGIGRRDAVLPWDIIDGGSKSAFYRSEFEKGLREEWTLPPKRAAENIRLLPIVP